MDIFCETGQKRLLLQFELTTADNIRPVALIYIKYFKYLHSTGHDGTRLRVKCLLAKAVNAQVTDGVIEYICNMYYYRE